MKEYEDDPLYEADEPSPEAIHEADGSGAANGWEETGAVQSIVLMRIYDVLLAILREQNPGLAHNIDEAHRQGYILGADPMFRPGKPG